MMRGGMTAVGRTILAPALLLILSAATAPAGADPSFLIAQAGSAGGTLGNDDKSVSGAPAAPVKRTLTAPVVKKTPAAHAAPPPPIKHPRAVAKAPEPEEQEAAPRRPAKVNTESLSSYDGAYAGASTGPCILRWSWSFDVANGVMTGGSGSNISGRISASGNAVGKMVVFGTTYSFVGHLTRTGAAGTWVKPGPDGCTGTWMATR